MDVRRFDTIVRLFANRHAERAVTQGGAPAAARPPMDPDNPHPSADDANHQEFLFAQPFSTGTWSPKAGEGGVYTLTLSGAAAHTIYFSDRPERIVGITPIQEFLDGLGFTPANPPNAAIVAADAPDTQDILVIELLNPFWDATTGTLTYDARMLADYGEPGLADLASQQGDYELAETFGAGSLFIDGCANGWATCYQQFNNQAVAVGEITDLDCCWQSSSGSCTPCSDDQWAD